jgi:hypothetical protein
MTVAAAVVVLAQVAWASGGKQLIGMGHRHTTHGGVAGRRCHQAVVVVATRLLVGHHHVMLTRATAVLLGHRCVRKTLLPTSTLVGLRASPLAARPSGAQRTHRRSTHRTAAVHHREAHPVARGTGAAVSAVSAVLAVSALSAAESAVSVVVVLVVVVVVVVAVSVVLQEVDTKLTSPRTSRLTARLRRKRKTHVLVVALRLVDTVAVSAAVAVAMVRVDPRRPTCPCISNTSLSRSSSSSSSRPATVSREGHQLAGLVSPRDSRSIAGRSSNSSSNNNRVGTVILRRC